MMINNLYVLKMGSSSVMHGNNIYDQIHYLVKNNSKVLIIAGGNEAIKNKYNSCNIPIKRLLLKNGNTVRYTPAEDMPFIEDAYKNIIFKKLEQELDKRNISSYIQLSSKEHLIIGKLGKPLSTIKNNKNIIIRDSLYGSYVESNILMINKLLNTFEVVVLSPPIYEPSINKDINIDADMLAACLAVDINAAHLRFITSTPGLLKDINNFDTHIDDLFCEDFQKLDFVKGKMKQKIRAAKYACIYGSCDIAITGIHQLKNYTRIWNNKMNKFEDQLLANIISIPSVSGDEKALTNYLSNIKLSNCKSFIDNAGNIVFIKGEGSNVIFMLGHIDTVKNYWHVCANQKFIYGRGAVDAKSSFATFLSVLNSINPPKDYKIIVIGAVEEEISSSKGAFFVRDNYKQAPVIIGEPSGSSKITIGYNGLLKLKISVSTEQSHSAGKNVVSSIDQAINASNIFRTVIKHLDNKSMSSIQDIYHDSDSNMTNIILNFRISSDSIESYLSKLENVKPDEVKLELLRSTPSYRNKRSNMIVRLFTSSFKKIQHNIPSFVFKTGTSDMNTLATKWTVPMLAYGPGDSTLDHTLKEKINLCEYHIAVDTLKEFLKEFFKKGENYV